MGLATMMKKPSEQHLEGTLDYPPRNIEVSTIGRWLFHNFKTKTMEKLNPTQIETQLKNLEGWTYENGSHLQKSFVFQDFKDGLLRKMTNVLLL